jgi:glutathione S-transferase
VAGLVDFDLATLNNHFIAGDEYTIADMAIWPWYGNGMLNGASYSGGRFCNQSARIFFEAARRGERGPEGKGAQADRPITPSLG